MNVLATLPQGLPTIIIELAKTGQLALQVDPLVEYGIAMRGSYAVLSQTQS